VNRFKSTGIVRAVRDMRRNKKGAALVEFALTIPVINLIFFSLLQWSAVAYNHLLVQHAAFVAARAESVVHPGMVDSGTETDVLTAAQMLFPSNAQAVTVESGNPDATSQSMNTTTVTYKYPCTVPLGSAVVCSGSVFVLTASASFPNQGAASQKVWGNGGSGS
jgi:Flp pilus assembly protein TadG